MVMQQLRFIFNLLLFYYCIVGTFLTVECCSLFSFKFAILLSQHK